MISIKLMYIYCRRFYVNDVGGSWSQKRNKPKRMNLASIRHIDVCTLIEGATV